MNRHFTTPRIAKVLRTAALALVAGTSLSMAQHNHTLCEGFLPENDMKVPVGFKSFAPGAAGLDQAEFNAVLDRTERIFTPVIAQAGGTFKVNRLWSDATVNASAQQNGRTWVINMYGGLARHPATTVEGFALVVCHEIGHHIGGAPKLKGFLGFGGWATNEGGSDYYAGLKCLRDFFAEDDNETIIAEATLDGRLTKFAAGLCDEQFAKDSDRLLCKRTAIGGTSVAGLFQALRKETSPPDFEKPDTNKVSKTDDKHPATQCRMDTYLAGALCDVDKSVALSDKDYRQGSCVENVAKLGFRPRCWFAP